MRRRAFLGLAAAGSLAGCGYRSVDAEYEQPAGAVPKQYARRTRVVFWSSYGGANGKAIGKLVAKFNESQQDVYVEAQFQGSYDDVAQKVAASLIARQAPDIAVLSDVTWERFYLNDALEPLNGYFTDGFGPAVYQQKLFGEYVVKGQSWCVPFARSTPILYFNRDAFAKAGLPDRAPRTWSELRSWGPELARVQAGGRSLRSLALAKVDGDWQFQGNVWQFGGAYSNGLDVTIDQDGAVAAGEWQRRMVHDDGFAYMANSAMTDFANGLVAMVQDSTGGLKSAMSKAKFKVGAGFVPSEVAAGIATGGGGIGMLRNASPERKQAAAAFLAFLARPENSAWWTTQTGYLPVVNAAREDPALKKLIADEPNYGVAIEQLTNARKQDAIRLFGRNSNVVIYTGLQQIYADNASPRKVFGAVARRLEAIGDEVRRQYEEKVL
ncbi:carbohydrate ABC transporter substrate-binding protein (CUT1 family) [Kribbella voronezhensis]|uniref:Carbohydrate ABC transporter substrate-binding protein (CUT1 family) n=1 Tax=Kribbella voronezhensis TaxID=2512212 RepID=A0A4V3FKJ0_9ACTN|nr:ABC transporter substrate-binding protein [Kribbella voronezhensis]TDU90383.1 carbohydrate ABC transporter substrate-binding protein (CUT1 family) [Kribbella voronezhensis]